MGRPISTHQLTMLGVAFLLAAALLGTLAGGTSYRVAGQQTIEQSQGSEVFMLNHGVSADEQHGHHAHSATSGQAAGRHSHMIEALGIIVVALVMLGSLAQQWLKR